MGSLRLEVGAPWLEGEVIFIDSGFVSLAKNALND